MPDDILRPTADHSSSGASINKVGSSAAFHVILSDNTDTTYLQLFDPTQNTLDETLAALSLSPEEYVVQYRIALRWQCSGGGLSSMSAQVIDSIGTDGPIANFTQSQSAAFATSYSQWFTAAPNGNAFSGVSDFSRLFVIANNAGTTTDPLLADVWVEVITNNSPTAIATAPVGSIETSQPQVVWTYSDADGDVQERYQVRIFPKNVAISGGFDARPGGTTIPTAESGEVFSSTNVWNCDTSLQNRTTYRAYVFVADANSGGHYNYQTNSEYLSDYVEFTTSILPPAVPSISALTQIGSNGVELTIQDRQNALIIGDQGFEINNIGGPASPWNAPVNCTVTVSTDFAEDGTHSMKMVGTSSGVVATARTSFYDYVVPGLTYTAAASLYCPTTARSVRLDIGWYDVTNALISTTSGITVPESIASGFVQAIASGAAPSNAVSFALIINIIAINSGEAHYLDDALIVPGSLNMIDDPIFEIDTSGDGVADIWFISTSNTPGGDPTPTYSLDTATVFAGVSSQRIDITTNTGLKGQATQSIGNFASGIVYTLSAWVRSTVACHVVLSADNQSSTSGNLALAAGAWTRLTYTFTASTTGNGHLKIQTDLANGTFWIGHGQVELGSAATQEGCGYRNYSPGEAPFVPGVGGSPITLGTYWDIQRSTDGGVTWAFLDRVFVNASTLIAFESIPDLVGKAQQLSIYDYEAPRGVPLRYRTRAVVPTGTTAVVSQWGVWAGPITLPKTNMVISDPTDPTRTVVIGVDQHSIDESRDETQAAHYTMGRADPVIVNGTIRLGTFDVAMGFPTDAAYAKWKVLQDSQRVLLLQTCYGDTVADQFYFTIDPTVQTSTVTTDAMARGQLRRVAFTAREAVAP